jgi:hypothetical protein
MHGFHRFIASPFALAATGVLLAAFMAFVLPLPAFSGAIVAGDGSAFDLDFSYSADEAFERVAAFSGAGREPFVRAHWTWDLAYPLVYGAFFLCAGAFALERLAPGSRAARVLPWLGLAAPLFDLAENAAVSVLVALAPARDGAAALAARAAVVATPVKWLAVGAAFALVAALFAALGTEALRRRFAGAGSVAP